MDTDQLELMLLQKRLKAVNFIESGCGPIVIEVEYAEKDKVQKELIKDSQGEVVTCHNLKEGYDICLKAGIHEANLIQMDTDDEACQATFANYHREVIPLKF
ncbi:hypothetical protein [uncultured Neptuniibacter sp.]|uniref:hypothetical protein n=1 Tax=uncultured Neptuniibacter sp. TaxID=502143 RepID=UPI00261DAD84|nr:hypothetical protein [uncultured Neptuniibacter sp.]